MEWLPHMLHALPCKKETDVGSVNLVREHEGWKISEDSWMELEAAEAEAFFVNVAEAFFVNVLVTEEEEMEESESIEKEEEEESVRLEQELCNYVSERKFTRRRHTEVDRGSGPGSSWGTPQEHAEGGRSWRWVEPMDQMGILPLVGGLLFCLTDHIQG
jgi:hypothetical protein